MTTEAQPVSPANDPEEEVLLRCPVCNMRHAATPLIAQIVRLLRWMKKRRPLVERDRSRA